MKRAVCVKNGLALIPERELEGIPLVSTDMVVKVFGELYIIEKAKSYVSSCKIDHILEKHNSYLLSEYKI